MKERHRFPVLDALRGVAAVAVVSLHGTPYLGRIQGRSLFPHGNLAVDFFFMLSGFVLTLAYQERLDGGWRLSEFMKARVIRLYPLYGLALVVGLAAEMARVLGGGKGIAPGYLMLFFAIGSVMLPLPPSLTKGVLPQFPLNFPSWSLFSELVANLVHGLVLRRRSVKFLAAVTAGAAAWFVWAMLQELRHQPGISGEDMLNETPWVVRVLLSYTLGTLLFRIWKTGKWRIELPPVVVAVVLLAVMAIPGVRHELTLDLVTIFVVFPLLLLAGAGGRLTARMVTVATVLGQASYAVYVLHIPVADTLHLLWGRVMRSPMERSAPWSGMVYMVVVFALALWLDRMYDGPVRGWLQRRFVKRPGVGVKEKAEV